MTDEKWGFNIFVSCVSDDQELEFVDDVVSRLTRSRHNITYSKRENHDGSLEFSTRDTIEKLDESLAGADIVLQILGANVGSPANSDAIDSFLSSNDTFLSAHPKVKEVFENSYYQLTYTQWEGLLAVHRKESGCVLMICCPIARPNRGGNADYIENMHSYGRYGLVEYAISKPQEAVDEIVKDVEKLWKKRDEEQANRGRENIARLRIEMWTVKYETRKNEVESIRNIILAITDGQAADDGLLHSLRVTEANIQMI